MLWPFSSYPVRALDDVAFKEYDYVIIGGESLSSSQASSIIQRMFTQVGLQAVLSLRVSAKIRV
jgi:hypothetical protein